MVPTCKILHAPAVNSDSLRISGRKSVFQFAEQILARVIVMVVCSLLVLPCAFTAYSHK